MIKKGLIVGVINLVVGMGLNYVLQALFPALALEYQNTALFRPWSDPLMMLFLAYPFVLGIAAAYLWSIVGTKFTDNAYKKAFGFAKLYLIIATIPGMFASYTCFQASFLMILSWVLSGFVQVYIAGLVFAKMK